MSLTLRGTTATLFSWLRSAMAQKRYTAQAAAKPRVQEKPFWGVILAFIMRTLADVKLLTQRGLGSFPGHRVNNNSVLVAEWRRNAPHPHSLESTLNNPVFCLDNPGHLSVPEGAHRMLGSPGEERSEEPRQLRQTQDNRQSTSRIVHMSTFLWTICRLLTMQSWRPFFQALTSVSLSTRGSFQHETQKPPGGDHALLG